MDYAELLVAERPLIRKLNDQLNKRDLDGALQTSLELKVLFTHLYWHLAEIPHKGLTYAGFTPTQEADRQ